MPTPFAVAAALEGIAVLAAAGAAAAALLDRDRRRRPLFMLAALVLAALALTTLLGGELSRHPEAAAMGAAAGLVGVVALAALLRRFPAALAPLVVGTLAFRVPLPVGGETASLLVPLYGVTAAACLAQAWTWLRPGAQAPDGGPAGEEVDPRLRRLELALAAVLVLYALQALYSTDLEQAVKNVCLFYVPFAMLFLLLLEVRWNRRVLVATFGLAVGLSLLFAAVGFVEYATGRLLLVNAKVQEANDLKPYFRVNSLFFDPNIYGRFLALTMTGLAAALLWSRRRRDVWLVAGALAVLWAGLVLSLSQSSFVALLMGLAVLAALRWRAWPVLAAASAAAAVAVAVVLIAPSAVSLDIGKRKALDRATSGRATLVRGAAEMIRDRPVWGYGSGAFAQVYRTRERVRSERVVAASHTIPLTVTAEQGALGLAAYLALLWAAFSLLFAGLHAALRREPPGVVAVTRAAVAASFSALVLHTLVYAAFLEDPLTWTLLAVGAGLLAAREADAAPARVAGQPDAVPTL